MPPRGRSLNPNTPTPSASRPFNPATQVGSQTQGLPQQPNAEAWKGIGDRYMQELAKAYSAAIGADVKKVHVSNPEKFGAIVNAVDMLKGEKVGQGLDPVEAGNAAFLDVFSGMGVDHFKAGIAPGLSMMLADKQKEELRNAPEPSQFQNIKTGFTDPEGNLTPMSVVRGISGTLGSGDMGINKGPLQPSYDQEGIAARAALGNPFTPTIPKSFADNTGGFNRVARETLRDLSSPAAIGTTPVMAGATTAGAAGLRIAAVKAASSSPAKAKALTLAANLIDDGTYATALRMEAQGELGASLLINALEEQGVEMNLAQQIGVGLIGGGAGIVGPAVIKRGAGAAIDSTRRSLEGPNLNNIAGLDPTRAGKVDRLLYDTRRAEGEQQRVLDDATSERASVVDDGIYEDPADFIEQGAPNIDRTDWGNRTESGEERLADLRTTFGGDNRARPHLTPDGKPIPLTKEEYSELGYGMGDQVAFSEEALMPRERTDSDLVRISKDGIEPLNTSALDEDDLVGRLAIESDPSRAAGNYKGMKSPLLNKKDFGEYVETRTPEEIAAPETRNGKFKVEKRDDRYDHGTSEGGAYLVSKLNPETGEFVYVAEFGVDRVSERSNVNPDSDVEVPYNYELSIAGTSRDGSRLSYEDFDQKAAFGTNAEGAFNLARVLDKVIDLIEAPSGRGEFARGNVIGIKGDRMHGTQNTIALRATDIRRFAGGKVNLLPGAKNVNKQRGALGPVSAIARNFKDVKIGLSRSFPNIPENLIDDQVEILKRRYAAISNGMAGRSVTESQWLRQRFAGFNVDGLVMMDDGKLLSPTSRSGVEGSTVFLPPISQRNGYSVVDDVVRAVIGSNFGKAAGDIDPQRMVDEIETMFHEIGHVIRRDIYDMNPDSRLILERYAGAEGGTWTRDAEEKFARGYVNYLANPDEFLRAGLEGINVGARGMEGLKEIFGQITHWLRQVTLNDSGAAGTGGRSSLTEVEFKAFDDIFYNSKARPNRSTWQVDAIDPATGKPEPNPFGDRGNRRTQIDNPNRWWNVPGQEANDTPPINRIRSEEADAYLGRDPSSNPDSASYDPFSSLALRPGPPEREVRRRIMGTTSLPGERATGARESTGIPLLDSEIGVSGPRTWVEAGEPFYAETDLINSTTDSISIVRVIPRLTPEQSLTNPSNHLTFLVKREGSEGDAIVGLQRIERNRPRGITDANGWEMHLASTDRSAVGEAFNAEELNLVAARIMQETRSPRISGISNMPSLSEQGPVRSFVDRGSRDEEALNAARERRGNRGQSLDDQLEADIAAARGNAYGSSEGPYTQANIDALSPENKFAQKIMEARQKRRDMGFRDPANPTDVEIEKKAWSGRQVPFDVSSRIINDDLTPKMLSVIRNRTKASNETILLRTEANKANAAKGANVRADQRYSGRDAAARAQNAALPTGNKPIADYDFDALTEAQFNESDIHIVFENINRDPSMREFTKINTLKAVIKLIDGEHVTPFDLVRLRSVFGKEVVSGMFDTRGFKRKAFDEIMEILQIPRMLLATLDFSAPLRQGLLSLGGHPVRWTKTMGPAFKAALSGNYEAGLTARRQNHKNYEFFTNSSSDKLPEDQRGLGVFQSDPEGAMSGREEAFMSRFLQNMPDRVGKIPKVGKTLQPIVRGVGQIMGYPIRFSDRGYNSFLNELRYNLMNDAWENWKASGKGFLKDGTPTPQTLKDGRALARWFNISTGRGDLMKLEGFAPELANILFSPRLVAARLEAPLELLRLDHSLRVKQHIVRDMVGTTMLGTSVLGAAAMAGADVDMDPTSSDFGRIQVGNTRVDIWGGFQPLVRTIFRVGQQRRKSTGTGKSTDLDGQLGTEILNFWRNKLAPVPGFAVDVTQKGSFTGDEINFEDENVVRELKARFLPLILQDMEESFREDGLTGLWLTVPSFLGTSVISYQGVEELTRRDYKFPDGREQPTGVDRLPILGESSYSMFQELPPFLQDHAIRMNKFETNRSASEFSEIIEEIDSDYWDTMVGIMSDEDITDSVKVSQYFDAGNTRADKRSGAFSAQYGEFEGSDIEPKDDNAKALRSYYDMIADAIDSDKGFDNEFFNSTYDDYLASWTDEQTEWVRANTNNKQIPDDMFNILPEKQKANIAASDAARLSLTEKWAKSSEEITNEIGALKPDVETTQTDLKTRQEVVEESRRANRERDGLSPISDSSGYQIPDRLKTPSRSGTGTTTPNRGTGSTTSSNGYALPDRFTR